MHKRIYPIILILSVTSPSTTFLNASLDAEKNNESETAKTAYELPPYVVVATRTPLSLNQVSPSVSYISEESMKQNQDRSLVDVLERQPGVVLNSNGARGSLSGLFLRGTESNHTSFFLDGRRLNPAFSNQFDLEFLSINNLSSVQIQRGPSSVNFGSAGIGGVISLQTKSDLGEKTNSVTAEVEYGSYDYYRGALNASLADEDWAVSFGASGLTTENKRNNDTFDNFGANSRIEYKLAEGLVAELISFITDTDKELPGSVSFPSDTSFNKTQSWLISPGLCFENEDWSGRIFYSNSKQFLEGVDTFSEPKSSVKSNEIYFQSDYSGLERIIFSIGALYRNDETRNDNLGYLENFGQAGLWAQIQWQLLKALGVRLGGRYDKYTDFDSSADGNVEIIYSLTDLGTDFFAKLATSYSPPSSLELAFDSDPWGTALNPEESTSYEIGFRQNLLGNKLNLSSVIFRNEIDDLVFFVGSDAINVNRATTEGIEFNAQYNPLESLSLGIGYTYLTALDNGMDQRLLRRPRHILQLSTNYQITEKLHFGIQGIGYFGREDAIFGPAPDFSRIQVDQEDYFVINALTNYKITDRLNLFARVENLLDEDYESVLGFPALGRAGYIGARLGF